MGMRMTTEEFNRLFAKNPDLADQRIVVPKKRIRVLETAFNTHWVWAGGKTEDWETDYKFDLPESGMEFDFAMLDIRIGVEVNGGQNRGGESGHGNWYGLERDAVKQNQAHYKGWQLFVFTTSMVNHLHIKPFYEYVKQRREDFYENIGRNAP